MADTDKPLYKTTGSYYGVMDPPRPRDLPFRPEGQETARLPPPANYYVDQIDNGQAALVDEKGNVTFVPATSGMHEGRNLDGSLPNTDGADIRRRLSAGDTGGNFSLETLGSALPKVPLAPGSPGPAVPPPADGFIGKPKGRKPGPKQRRTVP